MRAFKASTMPARAHSSAWVADRSIDFLQQRDRSQPFLLWSSFIDPHPPFSPPVPWNKLYRGTLMPLLNDDPAAVAAGRQVLRFALIFGVFNGLWLVVGNALAGAGDATAAMLINIAALWAVQLPACWLLSSVAGLGSVGIWLGMIVGSATNAVGMAWRF